MTTYPIASNFFLKKISFSNGELESNLSKLYGFVSMTCILENKLTQCSCFRYFKIIHIYSNKKKSSDGPI